MPAFDRGEFYTFLLDIPVSSRTAYNYCNYVESMISQCRPFSSKRLQKFFDGLFRQYKYNQLSASSYRKYYNALGYWIKFKKLKVHVDLKPAIEHPKIKAKLSYEESMAVISCPQPQSKGKYQSEWNKWSMYWRCLLWIPSRPSEMLQITTDRFDLSRKMVVVAQDKVGGREKEVPLEAGIYPYLQPYFQTLKSKLLFPAKNEPNRVLNVASAEKDLKLRLRLLGIDKKATPNSFRHSWATRVNGNSGSIMGVKTLLGHTKLESTFHYIGPDDKLLKDTMKADPFLSEFLQPVEKLQSALREWEKFKFMQDDRFDPVKFQQAIAMLYSAIKH